MKTVIMPQAKQLFVVNESERAVASGNGQPTFTVLIQSTTGTPTIYGNKLIEQFARAYVNMNEAQLLALLDECGLLPDDEKAISNVEELAKVLPGALKAHKKAGLHRFEVVTQETLEAQYKDQQVAGSLARGKVYVDKDGKPVYRGTRAYVIEGYTVKSGDKIIYSSEKDMPLFTAAYESGRTDVSPIIQALGKALNIATENEGDLEMFTSDQTGRIAMPQNVRIIAGSRKMSAEEIAERKRINVAVGRPELAISPVAPGENAVSATAEVPVGELVTAGDNSPVLDKPGAKGTAKPAEAVAPNLGATE